MGLIIKKKKIPDLAESNNHKKKIVKWKSRTTKKNSVKDNAKNKANSFFMAFK